MNNSSRKQFKVISSKTINHHINRTPSIQAYPKNEGKKLQSNLRFFMKNKFFEWQLYEGNPYFCTFEGNLVRNLKPMKTIFFMCLDMFFWLPLHGTKCKIWQRCNSSEENITSWDEQKAASSFGGKCAIARNLKTTALFHQFSVFFCHVQNISQTTFSERFSRMEEILNETEMSETQWVVLKKIDHDYPGNSYRFAGFGTFHPISFTLQKNKRNKWFPAFFTDCH